MGYAHGHSLTGFITQLKKPANGKADESQAGTSTEEPQNGEESKEEVPQDIFDLYEKLDRDDEDEEDEGAMKTVSFEVKQENVEDVQKRCVAFMIVLWYIQTCLPFRSLHNISGQTPRTTAFRRRGQTFRWLAKSARFFFFFLR